jgi:hypothetical protein
MERIDFVDLLLLKSLAAEVRDQTLSRSRFQEASQAIEKLERSINATMARIGSRSYSDWADPSRSNWLQPYIEAALACRLCTMINCGFCGSVPFKEGLMMLASNGRLDHRNVDHETLKKIAVALALVDPAPRDPELNGYEQATMSIIYFLWSRSLGFDLWAPKLLDGSWAGTMLDRMRAHSRGQRRVPCVARP